MKIVFYIPTMSTHDLHNKSPLMGVSSAHNGINGFDNPMQSRVSTNSHVCTTEIIINGTNLKKEYIHYIMQSTKKPFTEVP